MEDPKMSTLVASELRLLEIEQVSAEYQEDGAISRAITHRLDWLRGILRELQPETQKGTRA